nr:hypothetical protein [Mesorhizobium sp.]
MRNLLFWLLVAATGAVYATMAVWSLPRISDAAGGLMPFDLRPFGYTEAEAREFLRRLSDEGRSFYLTVQHRLDLAFPALLAATLVWTALRLPPPGWRAVRWVLIGAAVGGMVADYLENAAVAAMLSAAPDAVAVEQIAIASRWTVLKSLGATLAMSLGVVLPVRAVLVRLTTQKSMDTPS